MGDGEGGGDYIRLTVFTSFSPSPILVTSRRRISSCWLSSNVRHVPTIFFSFFPLLKKEKKNRFGLIQMPDTFNSLLRPHRLSAPDISISPCFVCWFVCFILTLNMTDFFPVKPRSCNLRLWTGSERKKYIYGCACFNSCIFSPWLN